MCVEDIIPPYMKMNIHNVARFSNIDVYTFKHIIWKNGCCNSVPRTTDGQCLPLTKGEKYGWKRTSHWISDGVYVDIFSLT